MTLLEIAAVKSAKFVKISDSLSAPRSAFCHRRRTFNIDEDAAPEREIVLLSNGCGALNQRAQVEVGIDFGLRSMTSAILLSIPRMC